MVKLSKLIKDRDTESNPVTAAWIKWRKEKWESELGLHYADGKYHPSMLAGCPALLFLRACGFSFSPPLEDFRPESCRIFDNGDAVHERIQVQCCHAGILDVSDFDSTMETPISVESLNIGGHCDGVLNFGPRTNTGKTFTMFGVECPIYKYANRRKRYVLEIKSINSRGFAQVKKNGPKPEHIWQANIYANALSDIKGVIFIYENKDTQEWEEFVLPLDRSVWDDVVAKVTQVNKWRAEYQKTSMIPKEVFKVARKSAKNRMPWEKRVAYDYLIPPIGRRDTIKLIPPKTKKKKTKKKKLNPLLRRRRRNATT